MNSITGGASAKSHSMNWAAVARSNPSDAKVVSSGTTFDIRPTKPVAPRTPAPIVPAYKNPAHDPKHVRQLRKDLAANTSCLNLWNKVISATARSAHAHVYVEALEAKIDGLRAWMNKVQDDPTQKHPVLDVSYYTTLIHAYGVARKPHRTVEVYAEMAEKGVVPDLWAHNALIAAHMKVGDTVVALGVFKMMKIIEMRADATTFLAMAPFFLDHGDLETVWDLFHTTFGGWFMPRGRLLSDPKQAAYLAWQLRRFADALDVPERKDAVQRVRQTLET